MKISIVCVGKIKEKFYTEAVNEYSKRLGKYCKFEIIEVNDEPTVENAGETLCNRIKEKEGERILSKIKADAFVCTLEINGKSLDSVELSKFLDTTFTKGHSHICFVIGGSLGLHKNVIDRSDFHLSFSKLTFPHQLMRVILTEQIYRSFRIINNEPYHK